MSSLPIGDDDLVAYVDTRLAPARRAEVETYLATHPEIAARVEADLAQRAALRDRLAPKAAEPIPARLRVANIAAARRARQGAQLRAMAAGVALMVAGGGAGWIANDLATASRPAGAPAAVTASNASFVDDAVGAYRTFVVEVAHPVEVRAGDEAHLVQWLSKRVGKPLKTPDLTAFGFRLMGGRVLPAGSAAAAMLMYDNDAGTRMTVYIRADQGAETAFQFLREGEVSTFTWLDRGFGFAVSAATDRDRLLPIAEAVYKSIGA